MAFKRLDFVQFSLFFIQWQRMVPVDRDDKASCIFTVVLYSLIGFFISACDCLSFPWDCDFAMEFAIDGIAYMVLCTHLIPEFNDLLWQELCY
ncbi:uncharacterized protein ASPGLDRAFT_1390141 [Aspergillus glaucus CBS 516.65]|uniref:Uncharacterized protein n=1 Tax=Aspergillus glaucus CBS 516.65 TaxID=1160497 RepID=A0A1L9VPD0_ASPGL|nr:hypothetical protein ASPGLDRAFT_1390141 [Aspergillus glaucus CBS 516.65]OJJ85778.1 hypothetical protein ASPGLDRAFT_1390141 [Aspergillus glaucus CBS 516.65]